MNFPPQVNEYSCGPSALHYFLAQQQHYHLLDYVIEALHPTPELGTMPRSIELFLEGLNIPYEILQWPVSSPLPRDRMPVLVNLNYEHEGDHYMVVREIDEDRNLTLWNPDTAELCYYSHQDFTHVWYSPLKKLKNWSLRLT